MSNENVKNLEVANEVVSDEAAQATEATKNAEREEMERNVLAEFDLAYRQTLANDKFEATEKTRRQKAIVKVGLAMATKDVLAGLQLASYVNSKGDRVIDARQVYDLLYRPEFASAIDTNKDTPEEWQFARIVLGRARAAAAQLANAKTTEEKKAAWKAWANSPYVRVGINIESVPKTDSNLDSLADAMRDFLLGR